MPLSGVVSVSGMKACHISSPYSFRVSRVCGARGYPASSSSSSRQLVRGYLRALRRPDGRRHAATAAVESSQDASAADVEQQQASGQQRLDVYEAPALLEEGVSKRTISIFVADESGMISRVAGVFARRGYNIDSLTVGLNYERALFTAVITGSETQTQGLMKQLCKLVNVRAVEDLSKTNCIERELMMVKVRAPPGPIRDRVLQEASVFRADVVDSGPKTLTVLCSGDPGKTFALQRALEEYGVEEVARTGKVALRRGAWVRGAKPQFAPSDVSSGGRDATAKQASVSPSDDDKGGEEEAETAQASASGEIQTGGGDTYGLDDSTGAGVWDVPVLDYDFGAPEVFDDNGRPFEPFTLSISVNDAPGVLNRLTGVFSRRGYNIQSLAVGPSESLGVSRITTVVPGTQETIRKLISQLNRMVDTLDIQNLTGRPFVERELMLVKVRCDPRHRGEVLDLANIFRSKVVDVSQNTMTIEVTGDNEKLAAFQDLLKPSLLEVARTGCLALFRESRVDTKLLEVVQSYDDI
ncbi:acetolactate synthase small subunit [Pseudoscourfieldia marina]